MGSSLRLGHRAWLLKVVFVLGMFVAAGIAVGVVSGADQPAISSDRSEYAPGEEVVLSGHGWQAGETVALVVDDDQDDAWTYASDVAAGEDGTVLDSFDLPELAGEFTVSATAPSGTAAATFTVTAPSEPEPAPNPPCAATGAETLGADKPGYLPGGRALLTGSGYEPSCDLVLRITLPDESVATETVTTDTGGGVGHVWALPSPAVPGEYLAETVDGGGAVLASTTFDGLEPTAGTPTIWTDRDDYAPGEIFELRGAGWLPGEAIQVVVDDDDGDTWLHTADVVAGADGKFMHEFQLPDWFVAVYTVTAIGALSGEATTTFTDSMSFGGCPAGAAPIVVTITTDEFLAAGGTGCSLREATRAANLDGAADTIVLTASATYTLTRAGTGNDDTGTGDLDLLNPLTITGNGATIEAHTTSGSGIDRVFHVLNGSLTVSNATIRHGRVGSGGGGGILTNGRPLTLSNATVTSNQTTGGSDGAGIHSAGGTVVVDDSTISGNAATGGGAEGGGLYSSGGTWTITDSTINGNTAASNAAGIWTSGTGTLTNVTLTENTSSGIAGGIRVDSSTTTITNATISHNAATGATTSGGIARTSGTVNLRNTIVANNVVGANLHANCATNDPSQLVNVGGNLDSGATCLFAALNGSQSAANPGLGSLAANGGPTMTRSIGPSSPAVDRSIAGAPANDQRGLGRTDGPDADLTAQADVGAYEFQAPTNTAPSVAYVSPATSATEGQTVTFNFQITDPDAGDTFTFVSSYPKCGTGGSLVAGSESINSAAKTGTFQCSFPDGTANPTVEVRVKDAANAESNTASQPVSVSNVPPSIAISGAASVNEGSTYTLTLGAVTDPGQDTVTGYVVHWGDGATDTYGSAGAKTHTYADGTATRSVTVDLVDEDGTHLNRGNAHSVQVDNVAPTVAISGSGSATEGSAYSLTLGAVTDPGQDTVTGYVVHWGDGDTDTYTTAGAKTHTYADGLATRSVTVDLVDDDGTHLNRANAHSVVVANVSPAVTPPANQTADEGTSETFDLGSFTDPGDDGPWQVTVDWGDGSTDTVFSEAGAGAIADKPHTYADDGPFTVTVAVAEDGGAGPSGSATFQVTVANVAPDVTAPAGQSGSEGTPASFALGSFTDPGDDDPWKVTVDWGDSSADTVFTETAPGAITGQAHTYADDGTYTVTVTVEEENGAGAGGTDTFQVSVTNVVPSVTPPADQAASEGTAATFDLGSFTDPGDDDPWEVTVDWGDGSADTVFTETTPGPIADKSHTYADNGPYTVTITVKEDNGTGVGGSATFAVAVANVAPAVAAPAPQSADEATSKSFGLGSFTDPGDDDPWQVTVNWGDGSADTVFAEASAGPIAAQSHTYADDGVFTVTVTVVEESGTGASGVATFQVTVANLPPDITAVTAESPIDEGDASTIAVTATDPAGANDPLSYHFDCDNNGTFEVGPQAASSHDCAFADNGTFTVNVRVTDGDGGADTGSDTVQVANVAPTVTAPANQAASEGTGGSFSLGSFTDPGDDDPWEVTVDWGDGSADTVFTEAATGAIAAKSHAFADDGTFTVTVTVDEDNGAGVHGTATFQVVVANVPPEVTAPADQSASEGTSASFALGSFTDPGDDDPWQITVDWGDGSADTVFTETTPGPIAGKSHTYADDGLYTVTVTVDEDNGAGAADAATFGVTVSNVAPNVTPPAGQTASEGTSKTFDLGSFTDPGDDDPWEVTVDWGDGSADTVFTEAATGAITDKAHTYVDDGAYTVTVTADEESGAGASGTATFQVTVANVAPTVAKPTFQPSSVGCQTSVTLTGISFSDPGVDDDPWTVDIDWGDLSPHTTYATSTRGAQPDQMHTYASSGGFTATVSVTDDHATGSNMSTAPVAVYRYSVEFRPPVEGSSTGHIVDNRMKNGRVVPVKVKIRDLCAGAELTDPNAAVTVAVTKASGTPGVDDPVAEYADAGASSDGTNRFRWSTEHWIYNLDSKALGFVIGNRYRVDVYVNGVRATVATWAILDPYK